MIIIDHQISMSFTTKYGEVQNLPSIPGCWCAMCHGPTKTSRTKVTEKLLRTASLEPGSKNPSFLVMIYNHCKVDIQKWWKERLRTLVFACNYINFRRQWRILAILSESLSLRNKYILHQAPNAFNKSICGAYFDHHTLTPTSPSPTFAKRAWGLTDGPVTTRVLKVPSRMTCDF